MKVDDVENILELEEKDFKQRLWNHCCWLFQSGLSKIYINSHLVANINNTEQRGKFAFQSQQNIVSSSFIIGQEQDKVGGAFSEKQIYQGFLAEFNIWDTLLGQEDILSMAKCSSWLKGNLFSWEKNNVELSGSARLDTIVEMSELCQDKVMFLFPKKRPLADASVLCSSLGGHLVVPKSVKENAELVRIFEEYPESCVDSSNMAVWVGLEKKAGKSEWSSVGNTSDSRGLEFTPANSIITTYDAYQCMVMMNDGGWKTLQDCNDVTNFLSACTVCEFNQIPMMGLKGACDIQNAPNWIYYLTRNGTYNYIFEGYKRDKIVNVNSSWLLEKASGQVFAKVKPKRQNGPIGRYSWTLDEYGNSLCPGPDDGKAPLTFSICSSDEFTCDSGHCINIYHRCDDHQDCADNSDEDNCEIVDVPDNYRKEPVQQNNGSISLIHTKVLITKFNSIKKSGDLEISLTIRMRWRDPRLTFLNIVDEDQHSGGKEKDISIEKQKALWLPLDNIVQKNAVIGDVIGQEESITFVRVIVGGNATAPSTENAVEGKSQSFILYFVRFFNFPLDLRFPGDKNDLYMVRDYKVTYMCDFEVNSLEFYFPFLPLVSGCSISV